MLIARTRFIALGKIATFQLFLFVMHLSAVFFYYINLKVNHTKELKFRFFFFIFETLIIFLLT